MHPIRAFVGIALPPACQELTQRLAAAIAPLSGTSMRRVRAGQAHLTLKFLGDVPGDGPAGIEAVEQALATVRFAPFPLRLGGGGFFPGPARPRVLWAGVRTGAEACRTLAGAVDAALVRLGFPAGRAPVTIHLTLGRLREPGRHGDWPAVLRLLTATDWPEIPVRTFTLWRSESGPDGMRHRVLGEFPAAAGT